MIGELQQIFNMLSAPMRSPPQLGIGDQRTIEAVFGSPRNPLRNPNDVQFHDVSIPTVPNAPVTIGLMQVVYDAQPCWDRGDVARTGPVRRFFRRWVNDQNQTRQP